MIRLVGLLLIVVAAMTALVVPDGSDERPPAEVVVRVVDTSGIEGAGLDLANGLRGRGYLIAGVTARRRFNFRGQGAVTVVCRAGLERERATLVKAVHRADVYEAKVPLPPTFAPDCIVGLRRLTEPLPIIATTTTTTDPRNEIEVTDDQIVAAIGGCPGTRCLVTGRIEFDHPTWGHSALVTLVERDADCGSRLAVIDQYGRARWQSPAGDGCFLDAAPPFVDGVPALPSVDGAGHLFLRYNPGRYDGVIVLKPIPDGFDDFNSLPTAITSGAYNARFYNAYVNDADHDGVFEIVESSNECPSCADGTITTITNKWNGADYVDYNASPVALTDLMGNWEMYDGTLRVRSDGTIEYAERELLPPEYEWRRIRLTLRIVAVEGNVARATVDTTNFSAIPVGTSYRFSIQRGYLISNGPNGAVYWCGVADSECET